MGITYLTLAKQIFEQLTDDRRHRHLPPHRADQCSAVPAARSALLDSCNAPADPSSCAAADYTTCMAAPVRGRATETRLAGFADDDMMLSTYCKVTWIHRERYAYLEVGADSGYGLVLLQYGKQGAALRLAGRGGRRGKPNGCCCCYYCRLIAAAALAGHRGAEATATNQLTAGTEVQAAVIERLQSSRAMKHGAKLDRRTSGAIGNKESKWMVDG